MLSMQELKELIALESKIRTGGHDYEYLGWINPDQVSVEELQNCIDKYGCSYAAKFILDSYAGATYRYVNEQLREERWVSCDEFSQAYKNKLNHVLDVLPSHNNQIVWRWLSIPDEGLEFLEGYIGKNIQIPQFYSTSTFKNEGGYQDFFRILTSEASHGKYIAKIVEKSEEEVLFKTDTIFTIQEFLEGFFILTETTEVEVDLVLFEYFWDEKMISSRANNILYRNQSYGRGRI